MTPPICRRATAPIAPAQSDENEWCHAPRLADWQSRPWLPQYARHCCDVSVDGPRIRLNKVAAHSPDEIPNFITRRHF
jgi:hypothetical protein